MTYPRPIKKTQRMDSYQLVVPVDSEAIEVISAFTILFVSSVVIAISELGVVLHCAWYI